MGWGPYSSVLQVKIATPPGVVPSMTLATTYFDGILRFNWGGANDNGAPITKSRVFFRSSSNTFYEDTTYCVVNLNYCELPYSVFI